MKKDYKKIDLASAEMPVPGPKGELLTSLPILTVLEQHQCMYLLRANFPLKGLQPSFYAVLNSMVKGVSSEERERPNAMIILKMAKSCPLEEGIGAIQLASKLIHGEEADVVFRSGTSYAATLALICDAARAGRPIILVGYEIEKLSKTYDSTMDPLGKVLIADALADKKRVIDEQPMKDFIFVHLLSRICDVLEGKEKGGFSFQVPARPDLGVSTDRVESLHALFENPREEVFDHIQIPSWTLLAFVDAEND
jgi:hypothetical protein